VAQGNPKIGRRKKRYIPTSSIEDPIRLKKPIIDGLRLGSATHEYKMCIVCVGVVGYTPILYVPKREEGFMR